MTEMTRHDAEARGANPGAGGPSDPRSRTEPGLTLGPETPLVVKSGRLILPLGGSGPAGPKAQAEATPTDAGRVLLALRADTTQRDLPEAPLRLWPLLARSFAAFPEAEVIEVDAALHETAREDPALPILLRETPDGEASAGRFCLRRMFFQTPAPWLRTPTASGFPLSRRPGPHGEPHPLRPPAPKGLVYERFDPQVGMTLSFRAVDPVRDLDLFHDWMNDGRVAVFWELAKPKAELAEYLWNLEQDPHSFGLIGAFDGEAAGYYEVYWAKEDRLGAHYDADDYDRGWHGLIGNRRHLGHAKTLAWLRALTHLLFLDDVRTRKVVGEPNAAHRKLLRYADAVAYRKVKEFDFPHKRAALMHCDRETFFATVRL